MSTTKNFLNIWFAKIRKREWVQTLLFSKSIHQNYYTDKK